MAQEQSPESIQQDLIRLGKTSGMEFPAFIRLLDEVKSAAFQRKKINTKEELQQLKSEYDALMKLQLQCHCHSDSLPELVQALGKLMYQRYCDIIWRAEAYDPADLSAFLVAWEVCFPEIAVTAKYPSQEARRLSREIHHLETLLGFNFLFKPEGCRAGYNPDTGQCCLLPEHPATSTFAILPWLSPSAQQTEFEHFMHGFFRAHFQRHPLPENPVQITRSDYDIKISQGFRHVSIHRVLKILRPVECQPEVPLYYFECWSADGHPFLCKVHAVDIISYVQPTAEQIQCYLRLLELLAQARQQSGDTPPDHEAPLLTYLRWVKAVLTIIGGQAGDMPEALSHRLTHQLAPSYPGVLSAVDFYQKRLKECHPLISLLKTAVCELRRDKTNYLYPHKTFFSETVITRRLGKCIRALAPGIGITTELESPDGVSKIDLLLTDNNTRQHLAIEAKIIHKQGGCQTDALGKALFVQTPAYAEISEVSACAVLYAFDLNLHEVNDSLQNLIEKENLIEKKNKKIRENVWALSVVKGNDLRHYRLTYRNACPVDVLVVCLKSRSNTQNHKDKNKHRQNKRRQKHRSARRPRSQPHEKIPSPFWANRHRF